MADDKMTNAVFRFHTTPNPGKSKDAGRPIFDEIEVCVITHPGDRNTQKVFPATEVWKYDINPQTGQREPITYAMRFPSQYLAFKNNAQQSGAGTPLEALPFLTPGKRLELKALNIHTAEALAGLDGQPLKQLGMGGRKYKEQAQEYLDEAAKSADTVALQAQIDSLKSRLSAYEAGGEVQRQEQKSPFADMDDESIKEWLKDATGSKPKGNPSRETLIRLADEVNEEMKAKRARADA